MNDSQLFVFRFHNSELSDITKVQRSWSLAITAKYFQILGIKSLKAKT